MRSRRKKWAAPYLEAHKEIVIEKIDAQDKFFLSRPLVLEVGAGKGDFAIAKEMFQSPEPWQED